MTRLDVLNKEKLVIENLHCLPFNLREDCKKYYDHEILCITAYGSCNPVYEDEEQNR